MMPAEQTSGHCVEVDVAIAGGGPAGCAAAISLRAHAPSLRVAIVEATAYDAPRIGETLQPATRRILEHLGVWDAFAAGRHQTTYGTAASWGTPEPVDNEFLFSAHGPGWHLDRRAFDAMLAVEAEERGVQVLRSTRLGELTRDANGWLLHLSGGATIRARFVIDGTGGPSLIARSCGARFETIDQLVAITGFFDHAATGDPRTMVESFAGGWWYTAALPDGRRIIACMTDADLARDGHWTQPDRWTDLLASMPLLRSRIGNGYSERPDGPLMVRPAQSRVLEPAAGEDWLACGDAASRFDPLSSQGITKALRSGVFASYAAGDLLTRGDTTGLERYRRYVREEFENYRKVRTSVYREEQRWSGSEFWRRRHAGEEPRDEHGEEIGESSGVWRLGVRRSSDEASGSRINQRLTIEDARDAVVPPA
jgi:2-polyprenyl-6-methoxyphenol hydroxylase-like FAD-dependent oxidoreductase